MKFILKLRVFHEFSGQNCFCLSVCVSERKRAAFSPLLCTDAAGEKKKKNSESVTKNERKERVSHTVPFFFSFRNCKVCVFIRI